MNQPSYPGDLGLLYVTEDSTLYYLNEFEDYRELSDKDFYILKGLIEHVQEKINERMWGLPVPTQGPES